MAANSLGKITVTTGGTPVRVTANHIGVNSIAFQQLAAQTGKIFIGTATLNKGTLVGVLAVLAVPTANILPSASFTIVNAPAGLDARDFWVDADVNGEGVLVSYTEQ